MKVGSFDMVIGEKSKERCAYRCYLILNKEKNVKRLNNLQPEFVHPFSSNNPYILKIVVKCA